MKKAATAALLMSISLAAFSVSVFASPIYGDIDGDGSITASDARHVLRAAVGLEELTEEEFRLADYDRNGELTAGDARMILRMSVGLEDAPVSDNHIFIPSCGMDADFVLGEVSQEAVNNNDIVCNLTLMNSDNPLFMGHSFGTFRKLPDIKVGDKIYLTLNGEQRTYTVTVSEPGTVIDNGTDIKGEATGTKLIYTSSTPTLHLYTCYIYYDRWIVIAELKS